MTGKKRKVDDSSRLSRGCDVVGFFNATNNEMIIFRQMHTPPRHNEYVLIDDYGIKFYGKVVWVKWCCYDGPFTCTIGLQPVTE